MEQFQGSAIANLVFAGLFVLYKFIDRKFGHSKCESDSRCCKCTTHEDSISDDLDDKSNDIIRDIEKEIAKLKGKFVASLREGTQKAVQRDRTLRSRPTIDSDLVEKGKAEEEV